jgi:arylsulfatase A-like enzyme
MYKPEELPFAENRFEPDAVTEFSLTNFGELRGYFGIPDGGDVPDDLAKNLIHGYCACVTYMDAQLGKVIAKLKSLDLWDNTVIVLWGDHGWKLGEHNSWSKHTNFEIDTRAPLIIRDPSSESFGTTTALAEFVDMYPTLCDLCNISIPKHCEGISLKPILENQDETVKDVAFSQYPRDNGVMGYAMRTDQYRYMEWTQTETKEVFAKELYDHSNDSQENKNIVNSVSQELLEQLSSQLTTGWKAVHKG